MSERDLSDALWALLGAATLLTVVISHLGPARLVRISVLVRRVESNRFGYVTLLLGWAWVGWHFFAR